MIPLPPDPWKILGVEKSADKSEIRSAYKKLVLKTHPDKVQDPALKAEKQEEFQKIQQAYELLNDDTERTKYEEQIQLMELRKQAALLSKNMPNSSAPRSSSKTSYYEIRTAEIRTAEPKQKGSSGGGKIYEHYSSPHTRSHEEVASRIYAVFDEGEKHARRTASYEKPSRRDEERREKEKEEKRRRKDEDERILRSREREREKEALERERERKEKKRLRELEDRLREKEEKLRDKERRRERKSPYVEDYEAAREEDVYAATRLDKKRSSSRKHSEYREKSMSRKDRDPSPVVEIVDISSSKTKDQTLKETAADYIARSRNAAAAAATGGASPIYPRSHAQEVFYQPPVPTPPPVDLEEESIRRSSARAAGRRASHDTPRERSSLHKQAPQDAYVVHATPPSKSRPIPSFQKAHSTPPVVPDSPPRVSRSNTVPLQEYSRPLDHPPTFSRTQTWAAGEDRRADYYGDYDESDDDHRQSHKHRRSRRARSPQAVYDYKIPERPKSSKRDPHYGYSESPSSRRFAPEVLESSGSGSYPGGFRVKESRHYTHDDVAYADIPYAYTTSDQYTTSPVYA